MSDMDRSVRKAVYPAAGLGTRFLPATKVLPKEMLVLVDRPIIQYGVEEALQSGIDNIILVTSRGKSIIEDHFDVAYELESLLERRGKRINSTKFVISRRSTWRPSARENLSDSDTPSWSPDLLSATNLSRLCSPTM